jgi:hypothetical protein
VFTGRALSPPEPNGGRPELAGLVRRIQALTFELRGAGLLASAAEAEADEADRFYDGSRRAWRMSGTAASKACLYSSGLNQRSGIS